MVLITSHSFSPSVTFLFSPFLFSVFSLFFLCFLQALLSKRSPNGQHRSQVPTKPTSENPKPLPWSPNLPENSRRRVYIDRDMDRPHEQAIHWDHRHDLSSSLQLFPGLQVNIKQHIFLLCFVCCYYNIYIFLKWNEEKIFSQKFVV